MNDFPTPAACSVVVVQADAPTRMQPEDLLRINAAQQRGRRCRLAAFASTRWITGPMQQVRFNGYSDHAHRRRRRRPA